MKNALFVCLLNFIVMIFLFLNCTNLKCNKGFQTVTAKNVIQKNCKLLIDNQSSLLILRD